MPGSLRGLPSGRLSRGLGAIVLLIATAGTAQAGASSELTYQGQSHAETDAAEVELRILSSDEVPLYAERHAAVSLDAGLFSVRLGDGEPVVGLLDEGLEGASDGFVEIFVDGEPLGPPERIVSLPEGAGLAIDPPSAELRVFDASGAPIGVYAGERLVGSDQFFAHRPDVGLTLALRGTTGELGAEGTTLFFDEPGCVGQSFVDLRLSGVVFGRGAHGFLVGTATQALAPLTTLSVRLPDGRCDDEAREIAGVVPVTEIASLPIQLPAVPPLHVGVLGE